MGVQFHSSTVQNVWQQLNLSGYIKDVVGYCPMSKIYFDPYLKNLYKH